VLEAFQQHGLDVELVIKKDGEEMLRLLDRIEAGKVPCPDLVLLDLNLPRRSGIEVLRQIRQGSRCGQTPVIIVTSSDAPKDRQLVAHLGANRYFQKPSSFDEFMHLGNVVKEVIAQSNKTS
jgi:DNA-binding response OmpR family regulator